MTPESQTKPIHAAEAPRRRPRTPANNPAATSRLLIVIGFFIVGAGPVGAQSPWVAELLASTPQRLVPSSPVAIGGQGVGFGKSVAIDGDLLAVGAPDENASEPSDTHVGAVYVYERQGSSWVEIQKLRAPTETEQEFFGASVAIARGEDLDGPLDYLIVGGPGFSSFTGRAHVFKRRTGESWQHETTLNLANPETGDRFGTSVAIDFFVPPNTLNGDPLFFVAIGAPNDEDPASMSNDDTGSVTIFQRAGGPPGWTGGGALTFYGLSASDFIGSAVAQSGVYVIAAGAGIDVPGGFNDGGALALRQENFTGTVFNYAPSYELQPSVPLLAGGIENSAALYSNIAAVGAPLDDTAFFNAGKVYIFDVAIGGMGTTRVEIASILGSSTSDRFGESVGISAHLLVVGAIGAGPDSSGQVIVHERGATNSDWTPVGAFDPAPPNPPFQCTVGQSVAIQNATVVIGCPAGAVADEGVYVYTGPDVIFSDGFESGQTTMWSSSTP
jgi:hypothetical protein